MTWYVQAAAAAAAAAVTATTVQKERNICPSSVETQHNTVTKEKKKQMLCDDQDEAKKKKKICTDNAPKNCEEKESKVSQEETPWSSSVFVFIYGWFSKFFFPLFLSSSLFLLSICRRALSPDHGHLEREENCVFSNMHFIFCY